MSVAINMIPTAASWTLAFIITTSIWVLETLKIAAWLDHLSLVKIICIIELISAWNSSSVREFAGFLCAKSSIVQNFSLKVLILDQCFPITIPNFEWKVIFHRKDPIHTKWGIRPDSLVFEVSWSKMAQSDVQIFLLFLDINFEHFLTSKKFYETPPSPTFCLPHTFRVVGSDLTT